MQGIVFYILGLLAANKSMENVVTCMVVGHWSQDGELKEAHINGSHSNCFLVSDGNEWETLIKTFSHNGQTMLVLMDGPEPGGINILL